MLNSENNAAGHRTFGDYLRMQRRTILLILALAFLTRMAFVAMASSPGGDAKYRYIITAVNLLNGNGFSADWSPPFRPGVATVPLYPLFIAAVYATFGHYETAVRISQVFLDLITCLLVAFASYSIAPPRLKERAATAALAIYGLYCWFTLLFTALLLTETLALFLTMLVVTFCIIAMRKGAWYWFYAGLACGLAILTRPDSLLLAGAVLLFLFLRAWRASFLEGARSLLAFCFAIALTLTPWTVRNLVVLGEFQPLASEYAFPQGGYMPTGYLQWVRTWITDETYFYQTFQPAFVPGSFRLEIDRLPENAFDSPDEQRHITMLAERYNQTLYFTPEISNGFGEIANERIRRDPLRFFLVLPIHRIASLWLTGFATRHPTNHILALRILSVLPIIIGGVLGFALWCWRSSSAMLLLTIIATRTGFLAYHYAPETRYIVEAYPALIAMCGVTVAAMWALFQSFRARV